MADDNGKVVPLFTGVEIVPDEQSVEIALHEALSAGYASVLVIGEKAGDVEPYIHTSNDWRPDDLWMLKQAERKLLSEEN